MNEEGNSAALTLEDITEGGDSGLGEMHQGTALGIICLTNARNMTLITLTNRPASSLQRVQGN